MFIQKVVVAIVFLMELNNTIQHEEKIPVPGNATEKNNINVMEEINFCEWSDEKLMKLIDFLGLMEITTKTDMESRLVNNKCVQKKWSYYDELIVEPETIRFAVDPYPSSVVFSAEQFIKMKVFYDTI
jgi:hypothetical protein